MKRFYTLFPILLLIVLLAACQSEPTAASPGACVTGCSEKPSLSIQSLNCASGIPNGGVVQVITTPATGTIKKTFGTPIIISAQVWRDDPNTPGIQYMYCQDTSVAVTWTFPDPNNVHKYTLAPTYPQKVYVTYGTAPAPNTGRVVGTINAGIGPVADTSVVTVNP